MVCYLLNCSVVLVPCFAYSCFLLIVSDRYPLYSSHRQAFGRWLVLVRTMLEGEEDMVSSETVQTAAQTVAQKARMCAYNPEVLRRDRCLGLPSMTLKHAEALMVALQPLDVWRSAATSIVPVIESLASARHVDHTAKVALIPISTLSTSSAPPGFSEVGKTSSAAGKPSRFLARSINAHSAGPVFMEQVNSLLYSCRNNL